MGCLTYQVDKFWLLTAEPRVQTWVTFCEIRGGQIGTTADFSRVSYFLFLIIINPRLLHIHPYATPDVHDSHKIIFSVY